MKKKGILFIIIAIALTIAVILYFLLKGKFGKNKIKPGTGTDLINDDNGSNSTTGTGTGNQSNTPPISPSQNLDHYIGSSLTAKYNETKLYDNDLNLIHTYNAGEFIGELGERAIGYVCCNDQPKFYKILKNNYSSGFCQCEPLMSYTALKAIFGIL